MAIEVRVPEEITNYHGKVLFGMSIRQLVCLGLAGATAVPLCAVLTKAVGMRISDAGYFVIFLVAPIIGAGFIRKDNLNFEDYVYLMVRHYLGQNRLTFADEEAPDVEYVLREEVNKQNGRKRRSGKEGKGKKTEAEIYQNTEKSSKRARKAAAQAIKQAKEEYRRAKRAESQKTA